MKTNKNVQVIAHGKSKGYMVLAIIKTYIILHPNVNLDDLRKAFPDRLFHHGRVKHIITPFEEIDESDGWDKYYKKENEIIVLKNGQKFVVAKIWIEECFNNILELAKKYNIETDFKDTSKCFEKGEFYIEIISKKLKFILFLRNFKRPLLLFLLLLLLGLLAIFLKKCSTTDATIDTPYKPTVAENRKDTVVKTNSTLVEKKTYRIQFSKAKSDLSAESVKILEQFVTQLKNNPKSKAMFIGHASSEGYAYYNDILSVERAKKAMEYVVSKGIDPTRISYKGEGSSKPQEVNNPKGAINRRTEFMIID